MVKIIDLIDRAKIFRRRNNFKVGLSVTGKYENMKNKKIELLIINLL